MKVVVIGATHAGVAAVRTILKYRPQTKVTVIERNSDITFAAAGIPLYLGGTINDLNVLSYASVSDLEALGAHMHMDSDAIHIDFEHKTVLAQNLINKQQFTCSYDKLVLATGSAVVVPSMRGVDAQHVMVVKDHPTAQKVVGAVRNNRHITIVGGGYVGTEIAESLSANHEVTIMQRNKQLLPLYYDREIATTVHHLLAVHGVNVMLNTSVTGFIQRDGLQVCTRNGEYPTDVALICSGFVPVSNLVSGHVDLDRRGAVVTNKFGQSSDPDIYAAGDVRSAYSNVLGRETYLPLASNAVRQGQLVGLNITGHRFHDRGSQGSTALSIYHHAFAATGLTLNQAKHYGLPAKASSFANWYRPTYMQPDKKVYVRLIFATDTHCILGAQLQGEQADIVQSNNTVSVMIQNHNTLEDLASVDMLFHPRFSNPLNYLAQAAQKAIDEVGILDDPE